jgi:SAM-dependent methyltransferase
VPVIAKPPFLLAPPLARGAARLWREPSFSEQSEVNRRCTLSLLGLFPPVQESAQGERLLAVCSAEAVQVMFDDMTDIYEAMIDWDRRLGNEAPFYRRLFERAEAHSVADVACGTGRHAAMFHSWGLRVEGADISPAMIERARANFGEPPGLRWAVRGFDQPFQPREPFDAATCVGNSLALARDMAAVEGAVREMFAAVRQGGVVVLHVLNLWRLPDGPVRWQKCKRAALERGEVLIVKGVHRSGSGGYMDLVVAPLDAPTQMQAESVAFLGVEAEQLEQIARKAGASSVQLLGGYNDQPYDRNGSEDLIVVVERG